MDSFIFEIRESVFLDSLLFNGDVDIANSTFKLWLVGLTCGDTLEECVNVDGDLFSDLRADAVSQNVSLNLVNNEESSHLELNNTLDISSTPEKEVYVKGLFITINTGGNSDKVVLYSILPQSISVNIGDTPETTLTLEQGTVFWSRNKNM